MENEIQIVIAIVIIIIVATSAFVIGGHLLDSKVLSCIQAGNSPDKCKCAFNACDY